MSRHITPQLGLGRKAVLVAAGLAALAMPIAIGMLNVSILGAQSQSRSQSSQPTPQPMAQLHSQPASQSTARPPAQAQAQVQQPRQAIPIPPSGPPQQVWTPTSDAPKNLLTPLEGEHHDLFINRAREGNIDIVFFGSTESEMWLWRERGLSVWDRTFGTRKAADFATQGTRSSSLQWRMRNGELDGYTAKLVVLQAQIGGFDGYVPQYRAIIAEIRARQPQAKILLFGIFPRSQAFTRGSQANAVLSALGDNESVFFIDISNRFFRPDGSFDTEMWNYGGLSVGMQKRAFEVWSEELQPWLDRFAR